MHEKYDGEAEGTDAYNSENEEFASTYHDPLQSGGHADVVTFLHRAGERYKEHLELLRRQRLAEERRVGPGRPMVSPFANEWSHQTTRKSEAVEDRLHRLHQKRLEKLASSRARAEHEREEKELEESRKKLDITDLGKQHTTRNPITVTKRFIDEHHKNLKRLAEDAVRREVAEVQSGPKITALASTSKLHERKHGLTIEEHLIQVEQRRKAKLYAMVEASKASVVNAPFHPSITRRAKLLAASEERGDVVQRLYQPNPMPAPAYDETFERECTFRPRTNKSHEDEFDDLGTSVYERLHDNVPRKEAVSPRRPRDLTPAEQQLSFTPKISVTSERIVERKRRMNADLSTMRSPTSRLYEEQLHKSSSQPLTPRGGHESALRDRGAPNGEATTMKPAINPKSEQIWRRVSQTIVERNSAGATSSEDDRGSAARDRSNHRRLHELWWQRKEQQKQAAVERVRKELEEAEVAECTFEPNARAGDMSAQHSARRQHPLEFTARENMWVMQRDQALQRLKQQNEDAQLEGCTFHPEVHKEIPIASAFVPNAVGFERHLRRQEEARARRRDEEALKARTPPPRTGHRHRGPTIPEPFVLGKEREQQRRNQEQLSERRQHAADGSWLHDSDDVAPIASLRPVVNFEEWSRLRSTWDDEQGGAHRPDPEMVYVDSRHRVSAPSSERKHRRVVYSPAPYHTGVMRVADEESYSDHYDEDTTFVVQRPPPSSYASNPSYASQTQPHQRGTQPPKPFYDTSASHQQQQVSSIMENHHAILQQLRTR